MDALAAEPTADDRRRGREIGMDQLVGPHGMGNLEAGAAAATVDEHAAAAAQPQLRALVVDVLGPGLRAGDRRLHAIRRRATVDTHQEVGRRLEASQPDAVGPERRRTRRLARCGHATFPIICGLQNARKVSA
jgi:hypothetical protein